MQASRADRRGVEPGVTRGGALLIDARSADRFAGQNETLDPVAGHIPGARNHPFARNLDAQGRFFLRGAASPPWEGSLRGAPPRQVIAMCGSGVTACHNLLALEIAGLTERGYMLARGANGSAIRRTRSRSGS